MKFCFNPHCRKPLKKFFSVNRKCEICQQIYCKECFTSKEKSFAILRSNGYCFNCFLSKNPEKLRDPEYFGSNLPFQRKHQTEILKKIKITNQNPLSRYRIISQAGMGEYARVFLVHDSENNPFALKELRDNQSDKLPVLEEVNPCYNSSCENIVKIHEVFLFKSKYSMLMEYMDCTLSQIIKTYRIFDTNFIGYIFREILKGVEFLHNNQILHRDLKPDNIFVSRAGSVKIGDLGICAQLTRERDQRDTFAGSPLWTAPEIILAKKYGKSCDIWSIGMVFYEMIEGMPFFARCKNLLQLQRAMNVKTPPKFTHEYPDDIMEFLINCTNYEPNLRKTSNQLLDSKLFFNIDENLARQTILSIIETPN